MKISINRIDLPSEKALNKFNFVKIKNKQFIEKTPVEVMNNKTVFLESLPINNKATYAGTAIFDSQRGLLAMHSFDLKDEQNSIVGSSMFVKEDERKKGLGELLRLTSIVEMLENKYDSIKLKSLPSAVQFHAKYGFRPNVKASENETLIQKALYEININDEQMAPRVIAMIKDIEDNGIKNSKHNYSEEIDDILAEYINKHKLDWSDTKLTINIPMSLSKKTLEASADEYNKMFKKFNLDYTI